MLIMLVSFQANAQVDVTFKVDMSGQTVSTDGVHVAGSINGWNTTANQLTQEGATNIYSAVIQLNEGWYEYKFLNGNAWGTDESAGYPCAPSNGNRFVYINNSGMPVTLEPVPFNGCNASGTGFEVTFNVDMASEGTIPAGNVHMAGSLTGWGADILSLPNATGDIHSGTLRLPTPANYPITFEYKYLSASGWGNEETPDASCPTVVGSNRLVTVSNSGESLGDVFNGCNYSLGIEDFIENDFKLLYDKDQRSLEFLSNSSYDISKIQVYDVNGRITTSISNLGSINEVKIDFQTITDGLYFVRIESDGKKMVKKIIIY